MFNYNIYKIWFKNAFPNLPRIEQNGGQLQW